MPRGNIRSRRVEYLSKLFEDKDKLSPESKLKLNQITRWADKNQKNKRTKGRMSNIIQDASLLAEAKELTKPQGESDGP